MWHGHQSDRRPALLTNREACKDKNTTSASSTRLGKWRRAFSRDKGGKNTGEASFPSFFLFMGSGLGVLVWEGGANVCTLSPQSLITSPHGRRISDGK